MKLSKRQQEALEKLSTTEWKSAQDVQVGLNTLFSLRNKNLAISKFEPGSNFFPRNCIMFKKKET